MQEISNLPLGLLKGTGVASGIGVLSLIDPMIAGGGLLAIVINKALDQAPEIIRALKEDPNRD